MTYRRALIPAAVGGALLTLLMLWAGASASALQLQGTGNVFDFESTTALRVLLSPWSFSGAGGGGPYTDLYRTAMQIRFVALFVFFLAGALLLLRRLPPVQGRTPATLLALWAWAPVAATLAVTVSAPWLIASRGHGSFRVLPQLAGVIASGGPVAVFAGLLTAPVAVVVARVLDNDAEPLPRRNVPPLAARLAASAGTAVVALSLVVLSYQSVAAWIQTSFPGEGLLSEPGDLLREWLLLGAWSDPSTTPLGDWLLYRAADVLVLAVVWWALRLLPALLTEATVPAMAAGAVCATVLGLLASQLLHWAMDDTTAVRGPVSLLADLGGGVPAALTFGAVAGIAAVVTLRLAGHRKTADASG
ncbi:hypothetical protein ABT052_46300 [Streptomyces sp. NPDC002766]|uniref:hypothetical protein n=1 Tax=unclassified Streptomyces TaxID=2593676 RepID=UPI00332ADB54